MTHLLELFFDAILIGCEEYEYRCPTVDANVIRVLPREIALAVMIPTTLVSRSLVKRVGKELSCVELVVCMLFGASKPKVLLETFPACICSGDTFRDNHYTDVLSTTAALK